MSPASICDLPIKSIALFLVLILAQLAHGEPHSWADNVCNESVPIQKDTIVEQPVVYEIKVHSVCGILPCVKTRQETRMDQTIKSVVRHVNKLTCCKGYIETPDRRCAPVCSEPCGPGGKCIQPDVCKCLAGPSPSSPGFSGATCRRFVCPVSNRWGASCERECQTNCSSNSYCSADTGKCVCEPGWHGANCDLECGPEDVLSSGCTFISQMPPIIEPNANLIVDNTVLSRTRQAEALMLADEGDDDVRVSKANSEDEARAWASLASRYLISLLSVMSLVLLVAFLIVKKRYEFVRNELYHASVASMARGSSGSGPGSEYSSSTYYSAGRTPSSDGKNPENNLSFAAATRNILSGVATDQNNGKKVLLFSPKTESHLIISQKNSKQNIYSQIHLASENTPTPRDAQTREEIYGDDDVEHIYQVPKRSPYVDASNSSFSEKPSDVSVDLGYDNDSNIYEEIKHREIDDKRNM